MADQIDVSKIVVVDQFITDLKEAQQWVLRVNDAIQGMSKAELSIKGINNVKSLESSINQLTSANKVLSDSINSIDKVQKQSNTTLTENANLRKTTTKIQIDEVQKLEQAEQKAYEKRQAAGSEQAESAALEKERLRQRNLEVKNVAIVNAAAQGSLEQLRAELALLTSEYDKLSEAERRSSKGDELQQKIKGQADALFKLESETGRYSRNVGNYTQATKILEQSLEELKQKMDDLNKSGEGNSDAMKKFQKEEQLLNQLLNSNAKGFSSLTMEIRANERALATMFNEGQSNTKAYKDLEREIANAKRELGEFREQQKLLSSQTPLLSAATLAAKGLAGAYAVGAGAAALFADGDEKVQKELSKLVAVMTVLQGLQEVHELLEKQGTIAKIASTVATKAQVIWQGILRTTLLQSAAATIAFRIALIALTGGLLLLVPLIALAGNKMSDIKSKTKDTEEAMKNLSEVTAKAGEKFAEAVSQVDKLKTTLKLAKDGVIDKKKALEEYNSTIGKVIGQAKSLNEAEQKLIDRAPDYIQFTFLKAKAEAAAELAKEALKKSVGTSAKGLDEFINFGDKAKAQVSSWQGVLSLFSTIPNVDAIIKTNEKLTVVAKKNKEDAIKIDEDKYHSFTKLEEQFYTDAAKFAKDHKLNFFEDSKTETDTKSNSLEKERQAKFEILKQEIQDRIEQQKILSSLEGPTENFRVTARQKQLDQEKLLADKEMEFELGAEKLTASQKELIRRNNIKKVNELEVQAGFDIVKIRKDVADETKQLLSETDAFYQRETQKEVDKLLVTLNNQLDIIQRSSRIQLDIELDRYSKGEINKEQYEQRKLEIENKTRKESLLAEIDYYEKLIRVSNLPGDKEAEALKKLSELRKQLHGIDVKDTEDANAKKEASDKKYHEQLRERLKELGDTIKETVFTLFESGIEKQKNQVREQIDLVEKRSSREIEIANQSILSEQDKAAKIAVINARAQAQKEALDRKSRELDQQKAKFEKAKSVAEIIENTSVAIVKTLADFPGPHGIALSVIIGAIGALNLAKALATPIPKYAKGKNGGDNYQGLAVVDEGRDGKGRAPEIIIRENGTIERGGDQPRITYLKARDIVIPHEKAKKIFEHRTSIEKLPTKSIGTREELPRFFVGKNHESRPLVNIIFPDIKNEGKTKNSHAKEVNSKEHLYRDHFDKDSVSKNENRFYDRLTSRHNDFKYPLLPNLKAIAWSATVQASEPYVQITNTSSGGLSREDYMHGVKKLESAIKNQPKPKKVDLDYLWFKNWMKQ